MGSPKRPKTAIYCVTLSSFGELLALLNETSIQNVPCAYRGNISPPLDARWHRGGWTSHFEWVTKPTAVTLDVFGHALRESFRWEQELVGLYASPQTVAEMKRTNRDKDWPFITALGVRMIESDDERGWLHIFDTEILQEMLGRSGCSSQLAARRPVLQLALAHDRRIAGAINAERKFWERLDQHRIRILEGHLRPYVAAVRKARYGRKLPLLEEHQVRIQCATQHLPPNPLKDYGLQRYIEEAKAALVDSDIVPASVLAWLPDVTAYFKWLNQ